MIHQLAILTFAFSALSTLGAETTTAPPVGATSTEHLDFAPGGTIRVKDSFGSLTVEGWDQPGVELTVVKSTGFKSEPPQQASEQLDAVRVTAARGSGTELIISTSRPAPRSIAHPLRNGSDVTLEYHIRAPRSSHLVISHEGGFVSVTGMTGDIEATSHRGDIVLMLPDLAACSIDAHTKFGLVTSDAAVATRHKLSPGENLREGGTTASRRLVLRMRFGGIAIKELPHEAFAAAPAGTN
jgi:hypothetical protein